MKFLDRLNIKTKIISSFIAVILVITAFIVIFFPIKYKSQAMKSLLNKATSIAEMTAYNIAPALDFQDTTMVLDIFEGLKLDTDLSYILLLDINDNKYASYQYEFEDGEIIYQSGVNIYRNHLNVNITVKSGDSRLGTLILGFSLKRINSQAGEYFRLILAVGIIILLGGVLLGWLISNAITQPINLLVKRVENISQQSGDWTTEIPVKSEDEIGKLAVAFNEMIRTLRDLVFKILNSADKVSNSAKKLSENSQDINTTTQEVSSTIQEISSGASNTALRVEEASQVLEKMATDVVNVAMSAQDAVKVINHINESVDSAVEVIKRLVKHSEKIHEFVAVISKITDQTNLLALNASIEAARAGEAGRGFNVVAEEVKKLADHSAEAADKIGTIIREIVLEIEEAVNKMSQSSSAVQEGKEVISNVSRSIKEIIAENTKQMEKNIHEIASMAEEAASATEETSASTEEITTAMEDMAASTQELYSLALHLRELVRKFNV
ncbi:methyl-accepting chemotaxis protein [bacterium]|nr:methyl-accepting chemotaxis protein [bacterium]